MNKIKLYINSNGTKVIITQYSLPSLKQILPSIKDINEHIQSQLGKKEFISIDIEVTTEKLEEINKDIKRKNCSDKGFSKITIYLESCNSKKVLPIIIIKEKQ